MKINKSFLYGKSKTECYQFIHKYYKKLPTNNDGSIKEFGSDFEDNDVDALRHAYVSGVFTQEYGETITNFLGILNEEMPLNGNSGLGDPRSENMDLWNNSIGRKYGKKTKSRLKLFKSLLKALKKNELILNLEDSRKYNGKIQSASNLKGKIVVIKESKKGKNLLYLDIDQQNILTRENFVLAIKQKAYANYEIRLIKGEETPVSKKDKIEPNNLG